MPRRITCTRKVGAVDLAPTFLELAGVTIPETVQGVSFAALLKDPAATSRDVIFAEHNWHVFQAHERMVRHGDWVYIRNAWPERQNLCVESTAEFPAGEELWAAEARGELQPQQRDIFMVPRAAEELYNLAADPEQMNNLAGDPAHENTSALPAEPAVTAENANRHVSVRVGQVDWSLRRFPRIHSQPVAG